MATGHTIASTQQGVSGATHSVLAKVFSFQALLGVILVTGLTVSIRENLPDPDMWSHIAIGQDILSSRHFPTVDSYSFTAGGKECMAFEWLGQVMLALAARVNGLSGLMALLEILGIVFYLLLYAAAWQRSANAKAAFVACALVLPLSAGFYTLRPQLPGYAFVLVTLLVLEQFRQGQRRFIWILPPLFLVWVNLHATFLLGFMVMGLYWFCGLWSFQWGGLQAVRWTPRQRQELLLVILACGIVLPITPYGIRLVTFPFHVALNAPLGTTYISEYQSIGTFALMLKVFLGLVLTYLVIQIGTRLVYRLEECALLFIGLYATAVHARFLLLFIVAFTPLLARQAAQWVPKYDPSKDRYVLNTALMAILLVIAAAFFPSRNDLESDVAKKFPVQAVAYLQQNPVQGPLLNEYGWGGYLIGSLYPRYQVFIDGRSQLYEDNGVFSDYLAVMRVDKNTVSILQKYNIQTCLLEKDAPLGTLLSVLPGWKRVYSDDISAIYVRK